MAKLTDQQKATIREKIHADSTLNDHAGKGKDADIAAVLNAIDPAIDVQREPVPASEFLSLIDPADVMGLTETHTRSLGLLMLGGTVDLLAQPTQTVIDAMPDKSRAAMTAHRTRKGSWTELTFGRQLDVNEISDALKADRPEGRIK